MAVVDSGRRTSSGKVIWKAKPSKYSTPSKSKSSSGGSSRTVIVPKKTSEEYKAEALANQRAAAEKKKSSSSGGSKVTPATASSKAEALEKLSQVAQVSEGIKQQIVQEKESPGSTTTIKKSSSTSQVQQKPMVQDVVQPPMLSASPKRNVYQKVEDTLSQWYQEASKPTNDVSVSKVVKGTAGFIGSYALGYGKAVFVDMPVGLYRTVTSPIKTAKGIYALATDKEVRSQAVQQFGNNFALNPAKSLGGITGILTAPKVYGKIGGKVKDVYVKAGSTPIDDTAVFSQKVLSGKETMPLSKGTKPALKQFNIKDASGKVTVQTSAPAKIKGDTVGVGRKVGLEDSGVYVTPKGQGSPYFLRIDGSITPEYSFSLNPFKDAFGVPTVTRFKLNKVVTYPKNVLNKPGFSAIDDFQKANVGKGTAYITKRSMIGQGELPAKSFKAPFNIKAGDLKVKAGQVVREAGTSEIEAVIGVGEKFKYTPASKIGKIKGFDYYTKFEGRAVAVRDATLITTKNAAKTQGSITISGGRVARETSAISSSISKPTITPYPSIFSLSSKASILNKPKTSQLVSIQPSLPKSTITSSNVKRLDKPVYDFSKPASQSSIIKQVSTPVYRTSRRSGGSRSSVISSPSYSSPIVSEPSYSSPISSKPSPISYKPRPSSSNPKPSSKPYGSSKPSSFSYGFGGSSYPGPSIKTPPYLQPPILPNYIRRNEKVIVKKKKQKKNKQLRGLTPTARARILNLKGKTTKGSIITGLGERYV